MTDERELAGAGWGVGRSDSCICVPYLLYLRNFFGGLVEDSSATGTGPSSKCCHFLWLLLTDFPATCYSESLFFDLSSPWLAGYPGCLLSAFYLHCSCKCTVKKFMHMRESSVLITYSHNYSCLEFWPNVTSIQILICDSEERERERGRVERESGENSYCWLAGLLTS